MKRPINLISTFFILFIGINNINAQVLVSSIMLVPVDGTSITTPGETKQIYAAVNPSNADNTTVTWSIVNNPGSAIISQSGLLTPGTNGVATVTATANDGSGVHASINITISNQPNVIPVTNVNIYPDGGITTITSNMLNLQMNVEVLPVNSTDPTITWGVTNVSGTATINQSGLLTPITDGAVIVTATSNYDQNIIGTSYITISQTANVNENKLPTISNYPNPINDILVIDNISETISISIYSMTGESVFSMKTNKNKEQIELSHFNSGIYFIKIESLNSKIIQKLIVE